ncbi:MAG: DUF3349 domain-containing protein [Nocardiaceae bacterium]|nr:DUF3349 domain-containing protein [Nocardiaceae bacterium]
MAVAGFLNRIARWFRAGYAHGVPKTGYEPLLALLERRLTWKEVKEVTRELIHGAQVTPAGIEPITRVDAAVAIAGRTNGLPAEEDIERVRARLEGKGWPFAE